jgi:hypothetical protein
MVEYRPLSGVSAPIERLVGALMASDSSEHVLRDALSAMIEARDMISIDAPLAATRALDRGIAQTRYALNLTDEEPPS